MTQSFTEKFNLRGVAIFLGVAMGPAALVVSLVIYFTEILPGENELANSYQTECMIKDTTLNVQRICGTKDHTWKFCIALSVIVVDSVFHTNNTALIRDWYFDSEGWVSDRWNDAAAFRDRLFPLNSTRECWCYLPASDRAGTALFVPPAEHLDESQRDAIIFLTMGLSLIVMGCCCCGIACKEWCREEQRKMMLRKAQHNDFASYAEPQKTEAKFSVTHSVLPDDTVLWHVSINAPPGGPALDEILPLPNAPDASLVIDT